MSCDAAGIVAQAFVASKTYGDGGVTTDGRSIAILSHCGSCIDTDSGIVIPEGQYFTCEGPPGARRSWEDAEPDAFWKAPASIVLDPQYFISRHKNTRLSNCFLRPNRLYPRTDASLPIPLFRQGQWPSWCS